MRYRDLTIIFLIAIAVFRIFYIAYGPFEISPDEAHYWEWSRRLDLSYYSKGPAVAYVIAFFTSIFGSNAFGIRIGAVLFSFAASLVIYLLGKGLFESEKVGFYSALLPNIAPIFSIGAILMTTDVLLIFFWAASVYCVYLGASRRRSGWWYLGGALIGAGFLSKYIMVLLYPCLLLYFLASREHRYWLKRPEPYIAGFISLAAATPVILWNILNKQVTIRHTLGQAHVGGGGISPGGLLEFVGSQAGILTPIIFAGLVYGTWMALTRGLKEKRGELLLVFFTSAPLFCFFLLKSMHAKVQANWAVAAFVTAFPAAAWAVDRLHKRLHPPGRKWVNGVVAVGIFMATAASIIVYFPWALEPFGARNVIMRPPFNRVTGWADLGKKVSAIKNEMKPSGEVFVMGETYQITSELALYMDGHPVAYNPNTGERRMNQYDLWPGPEGRGQNAVYVKGGNDAGIDQPVAAAFERCSKEVITADWKGRPVKDFTVFRCYGFKGFEKTDLNRF